MSDPGARGRLAGVADRLGMTEGQVYTVTLAVLLALGSALVGLPPVFSDRGGTNGIAAASSPAPAGPSTAAPDAGDAPDDPATGTPVFSAPPVPSPSPATPLRLPGGSSSDSDRRFPGGSPGSPSGSFDDDGAPGDRFTFAITAADGQPVDVAIGEAGDVWSVAGGEGGRLLLHHDAAGALVDRVVVPGEGDRGLAGVAVGPEGVVVVDGDSAEVLVHEPSTGVTERLATIPDVGPCLAVITTGACEPGPTDSPPRPVDVLIAPTGDLYVADAGQAAIWRIPQRGEPEVLIADAQLMGINGDGAARMDLDADGSIVVAVTTSAAGGTGGAVYRIPIDDADAGAPELVATMAPEEAPRGVAVGASGSIHVALAGTGEVLVLSPDGTELDRLPETPLAAPDGLAFRGGSLMVATADAGGGAIIRVPVGDVSARP